jgi:hypothetical protein
MVTPSGQDRPSNLGRIRLLLAALATAAILTVPALAVGPGSGFKPPPTKPPPSTKPPPKKTSGGGGSIPELDLGAAAGALTLLAGVTLILTDRVRRRK